MKKIGVIKEGKVPFDKRVAFSPKQCQLIGELFPEVNIVVQSSEIRCYTDEEYRAFGVEVVEDVSDCDILIGIKEVPKKDLIPGKQYLFFSHTIKKQPHNKGLLQEILNKKIQLIDYECLTDNNFNRMIGFGHYAGIVGTYNSIMAYGMRYNLFDLKPANLCRDMHELNVELQKVRLSNIKIIVTGNGRVANGAIELLGALRIRRITPYEFVSFSFREPTYTQLHSNNYNEPSDGSGWNQEAFYKDPTKFRSTFGKFTKDCDILIHCSFWDPRAPKLFSAEEMASPDFHIGVIGDVTCDIDGSIPSTTKASTIEEKFYGYDPQTKQITKPFVKNAITVMAVDNLPCELPRDASEDFGKELIDKILPLLLGKDENDVIERASITRNGMLNGRFSYLSDYVKE